MMKRVTWFVGGAVAGVAGAGYAKRKVKETAAQLAPANIAKTAAAKVRDRGHDVAEAVREGREAKRAKESELRAKLTDAAPIASELGPDDVILIDGRPVEAGQVIVLREVGERSERDDHVGPRRSSRRARRNG